MPAVEGRSLKGTGLQSEERKRLTRKGHEVELRNGFYWGRHTERAVPLPGTPGWEMSNKTHTSDSTSDYHGQLLLWGQKAVHKADFSN